MAGFFISVVRRGENLPFDKLSPRDNLDQGVARRSPKLANIAFPDPVTTAPNDPIKISHRNLD
jgi:hypothetical protein